MKNNLDQDFSVLSLLKFTAPATAMLVFISMYQMVDAVFVANYVGPNGLSALNIVYPAISIVLAVSIMLSSGGGAIIARNMGEGKGQEAKEKFSLIVYVGAGLGLVLLVLGVLFLEPLIWLMGATEGLYQYCWDYLTPILLATPIALLQVLFQMFFVTAGKPHLGLAMTVLGGFSNLLFDYIFIVEMKIGVLGAALGTVIGYTLPTVYGLVYFTVCRRGTIYLVRPRVHGRFLLDSCVNGSSEMVTNLAVAVTTFLFNIKMLRYVGEDGVAAITIVLYAQFLMTSVFMGFSGGVAPLFSYNYGCGDEARLKKLFRICMGFITITSVAVFVVGNLLQTQIITIFVSADSPVFALARHGFPLFAFSFLMTGYNIFASSMFTAFSNGLVSALISFLRTFLLLSICLLVLPQLMGADGIWWAVPVAEALALLVSGGFFLKLKNRYHYI